MPAKRYIYRGDVQGVGFRRRAAGLAADLAADALVTGYVRNLPDGSVELHAEGEARAVALFATRLSALLADHIASVEERDVAPMACTGFEIRR
jgi:acylphosphatase